MRADVLLDASARAVIGHRGAPRHLPENTLEGFTRAIALGADALELDVHLTADGAVVVAHDATVDRVTDGRGAIASLTLAQLLSLDAGARWSLDGGVTHPWRGRGLRMITFDALLEEHRDVPMMIDAKTPRVSAALAQVVARHGARSRVLVGSFDARNLAPFREPGWSRLATRGQGIALLARAVLHAPEASVDYAAIAVPDTLGPITIPIRLLARAAHARGRPLHVWTINDAPTARALWSAGANGIVGDDPALLRRVCDDLPDR